MAIDLQNPTNISSGWGRPPDYSAPSIGSTLSAILENRRAQQLLQQKQIADAVKQIQTQQQDKAYTEALRNAGLTQGQDISGLSSDDASKLAALIQGQTPDTDVDALHQAQAAQANATAAWINSGGKGPTVDYSEHELGETWYNENGDKMIQTTKGPKLVPVGMQPQDVRTTAPNASMANQSTYDALQKQMFDLQNESAYEREQNIKAQKAGVPFSRANEMTDIQKQMDALKPGGAPAASGSITPGPAAPKTVVPEEPNKPVTRGEKIDPTTAQQYLIKAQGNRAVAERMAQSDGWSL